MSYTLIERKELTGSASSIEFTSIPQTFTDLILLGSLRGSALSKFSGTLISLNTVTPTGRRVEGNGTSAYSQNFPTFAIPASTSTANTFNNFQAYFPGYTSSSNKTVSIDTTTENNDTESYINIVAGSYALTAGVTTILISSDSGSFVSGSSISLYGINRQQAIGKPKAIGGNITFANGYWVHTFNSSGSFYAQDDLECQYLIIAGGGSGGNSTGGGGGAGGYRSSVTGEFSGGLSAAEPPLKAKALNNYSVIVGAGGAAGGLAQNGSNSAFHNITSLGGGRGGSNSAGGFGGLGGSGGGSTDGVAGGSGTSGQGFSGGASIAWFGIYGAGGGGGAGSVGSAGNQSFGGNGGSGLSSSIAGSSAFRAGGGGGGTFQGTPTGIGGTGGGGAATFAGTANSGGGGGGSIDNLNLNAPGGSGIVIIRYLAS